MEISQENLKRKADQNITLKEENVSSEEFDDGYESDLMGGDSDRDELEEMTELEREKILSFRHKRRMELKRQFELKKEIKLKSKKRKLETNSAIQESQQQSKSKPIYQPKMIGMKIEEKSFEKKESKPQIEITIEDVEKVRLKRAFLEKHVSNLNFEEVVTGAYVRVISPYSQTNITKYVIAEIIGVAEEEEPYKLETKMTKKTLILKHAHKEKKFRMSFVSNGDFQESEFILWVHNMEQHAQQIPGKSKLLAKHAEIIKSQAVAVFYSS